MEQLNLKFCSQPGMESDLFFKINILIIWNRRDEFVINSNI